jgi:DNA polymerase-3 subunit alpha
MEGQHGGLPTLERDWIFESNQGLIALSGGREGDLGKLLLKNDQTRVDECLNAWTQHFADRYYIEIQRTGT